jgi:hypothetical protein
MEAAAAQSRKSRTDTVLVWSARHTIWDLVLYCWTVCGIIRAWEEHYCHSNTGNVAELVEELEAVSASALLSGVSGRPLSLVCRSLSLTCGDLLALSTPPSAIISRSFVAGVHRSCRRLEIIGLQMGNGRYRALI